MRWRGSATSLASRSGSEPRRRLLAPAEDAIRVVPLLWTGVALEAITGAYQIAWWTPFSLVPYPWRLTGMQQFRFGFTYTLVLAVKLGLVLLALTATVMLMVTARRSTERRGARAWIRGSAWVSVLTGLALAYTAMALLLVHEGVDHAL